MTTAELIAQWPVVACFLVTLAAFAAAGSAGDRRSGLRSVLVPAIVGAALVASTLPLFPGRPASQDAPVPHASYGASDALVQLAINAAFATPFVLWVVWRRRGTAALGLGRQDALRSVAVGACVSLACIAMLDRLSVPFWSSPGTWWLLLAMLGVGASEELIFRGLLLGSLARRLPRTAAEVFSAAIFSVVHLPHRLGGGLSAVEIALSLVLLLVWGWCYAAAMRTGKNVPGLALVHAIVNVCVIS